MKTGVFTSAARLSCLPSSHFPGLWRQRSFTHCYTKGQRFQGCLCLSESEDSACAGGSQVSAVILAIRVGEFESLVMGNLAKLTAKVGCDQQARCHVPPFQITPESHLQLLHRVTDAKRRRVTRWKEPRPCLEARLVNVEMQRKPEGSRAGGVGFIREEFYPCLSLLS